MYDDKGFLFSFILHKFAGKQFEMVLLRILWNIQKCFNDSATSIKLDIANYQFIVNLSSLMLVAND